MTTQQQTIKELISNFYTEYSDMFNSKLAFEYGQLMVSISNELKDDRNEDEEPEAIISLEELNSIISDTMKDIASEQNWRNLIDGEGVKDLDDYFSAVFNRHGFEFTDLTDINISSNVLVEIINEIKEDYGFSILEDYADITEYINLYATLKAYQIFKELDQERVNLNEFFYLANDEEEEEEEEEEE